VRSCQQSCRDGQALQESTLLGDAGQSHHGEKDCQDEELRKREAKAASVPQAGEGKRTAVSKELYLQTVEKKEASMRSKARLRKVLQRYC